MAPETVFSHAGNLAMLGWAILVFGPRRFGWLNAVPLWLIPAALSLLYAVLVLMHIAGSGGGYDSLEAVFDLMKDDWVLLAAWVHFLAFDLFVGALMAARMDRFAVGRIIQGPILISILMFGPLGFLIAAITEVGLRLALISGQMNKPKGAGHVTA